jgi:hypothetical protein
MDQGLKRGGCFAGFTDRNQREEGNEDDED